MPASASGDAQRHDPYRPFKFQVSIEGKVVAAMQKISPLRKKTAVIKWRSAGDPSHERLLPGGTEYEPITLERGLTRDTQFEEWANRVNNYAGDAATSLKDFRTEVVITLLNLKGEPVQEYRVHNAWVSEFQAMPGLDAGQLNAVAIQTITIQHEGWERDPAVGASAEQ